MVEYRLGRPAEEDKRSDRYAGESLRAMSPSSFAGGDPRHADAWRVPVPSARKEESTASPCRNLGRPSSHEATPTWLLGVATSSSTFASHLTLALAARGPLRPWRATHPHG